jgi:hypothetical protein
MVSMEDLVATQKEEETAMRAKEIATNKAAEEKVIADQKTLLNYKMTGKIIVNEYYALNGYKSDEACKDKLISNIEGIESLAGFNFRVINSKIGSGFSEKVLSVLFGNTCKVKTPMIIEQSLKLLAIDTCKEATSKDNIACADIEFNPGSEIREYYEGVKASVFAGEATGEAAAEF